MLLIWLCIQNVGDMLEARGFLCRTALLALTICQICGVPDVLRCLECHEVAEPGDCQNWAMCGQGEICYTSEFRDSAGKKGYHLGCEDEARCDLFMNTQSIIGRRRSEGVVSPMCYQCCNTNDCNAIGCVNDTDCSDILKKNRYATDGIYDIDPGDGHGPFEVYCDMTTDGGGWVVIQRRQDGSENFFRTWNEYRVGFGSLSGEFYLGNEKIHRLTSKGDNVLRVDLEDFNLTKAYATYDSFALGDSSSNYKLSIHSYLGTAGDSLSGHNGYGFSAKDKDVDTYSGNCAQIYHGAWWYSKCHSSNLNGQYNDTNYAEGVTWSSWRGQYNSLYRASMKIRPQ